MDNFLERPTLEGAGGQTDDTRSTFRPPWKLWGIPVQTSYWEGGWHQNCGNRSLILFFLGTDKEINEIGNLFVNRSAPENFQFGKSFRANSHRILLHSGFRKKIEKLFENILDPILVAQSWVSATKCDANIWGVTKNKHGHNFQNFRCKTNQRLLIGSEPMLALFDTSWKFIFSLNLA